ncbi:MAG: hypothetical protein SWE60_10075 [Thermodesulfobacteriota bacterium]|nr:hypothetical protein [Thermodesulfobacteriota bacterium]
MIAILLRFLTRLSVICAVVLPFSGEGSAESYPSSSLTTSVALSWPLAYVGGGSSGIKVIDLSQPGFPIIGSYNTPGFVHNLAIRDSLLYVADGSKGLLILDVSVPEVVVPRGRYATSGMAKAIALSDDLAYVADYAYGFQVIDVSEPSSPTYVAHSFDLGDIWALRVGPDGYLYIADVGNGVRIWDINNPSEPKGTGHIDTAGYALDMEVKAGISFVADG